MEKDQKQRITENLVFFTENTKDLKRLLVHFVAAGLISKGDKQVIESRSSESEKVYHMFTEIMKTGRYDDLIQILDEADNELIADKLKTLPSYANREQKLEVPENPSRPLSPTMDFELTRATVPGVVEVLGDHPSLQEEWLEIIARKLLSARNFGKLKKDASPSVLMMKTLDAWTEEKGSNATLRELANVIRPINHAASVALLDNSRKIRKV